MPKQPTPRKSAPALAKKTKPTKTATPVESIRHKDTRKNIPTEELRDFMAEDEAKPKVMLYPRDPSLDPQLVWKGKDEQDRSDLAVPVVPVYIQEKIHPQAIIDSLPRKDKPGDTQVDFFGDFNGLEGDFQQKVSFYQYDQHWSNRLILGDSLLVMTSLAEKEGLKGKVQTIYFDPPYGIKFGSNWQVSTRKREVKDSKAEDATRQPEQVRAFRDTWKLGIHSYLEYLRDRLLTSRDLLTETGNVFVQIGDANVHLVRSVLDELFGSENFVSIISFITSSGRTSGMLDCVSDFVLWYSKDAKLASRKYRQLYTQDLETFEKYGSDERGDYELADMTSQHPSETRSVPLEFNGETFRPSENRQWGFAPLNFPKLTNAQRVFRYSNRQIRWKKYSDERARGKLNNVWADTQFGAFASEKIYVVQTQRRVIERCLLMTTDPGDLVLDPTCGSGTTAAVAEQWGRRWITIDTSRVALALARTRLMAAKYPYYLLADSPEGIKKESELTAQVPPTHKTENDIRRGFVYKRVPHVTLKSIANNPDIKEGMTRQEIDAAIARHAEQETLYDQPYEDKKTVRVSGPFTVESLSPHRTVDGGVVDGGSEPSTIHLSPSTSSDFAILILDNLRKAGVQNTKKGERLKFETLDIFPGRWIHAAGTYIVDGGMVDGGSEPSAIHSSLSTKRVAVSLGPEHGTVGPQQVKEAAKEAVQGVGYDLLLVCGFAFDPHVAEEAKRYGKLTVLAARMNPDLAMGNELLKKTGAGNLFMVFGEPDVLVDSDEWMVDNLGRMVARYELVKRLSGLGSLEEINRAGRQDATYFQQLSTRGNVRTDVSDTTSGGIDSGEHRRGGGKKRNEGVHPIPGDSSGIGGGTGDTDRAGGGIRSSEQGLGGATLGGSDVHSKNALSPDEVVALKTLTATALPLSTINYTRVTILGVDVYDPTTGDIRSASTDDIACWFIDTNYNGESFFVRHAYFTGAEEPYEKLKRALRADIDEAAWSALYSTTSRPFPKPETGKIAIKVINHYGDEVLKVFEV